MSSRRNLLRHVSKYSFGIVISKLASILLLPVYTRYLTPADYGVLELLEISSSVIGTLIALRLSDAFFYFDYQSQDIRGKRTVLMTAYAGGILAGIGVGVTGWFCSALMSRAVFGTEQYTRGFHLVSIATGLAFVQEIGFAHLRALNKSGLFLGISLCRLGIQAIASVIFLVWYKRGYLGVQLGAMAASLAMCAIFISYALFRQRAPVHFALLGSMFRYSAPLGLSGVAMLFVHFGDRWFLKTSVSIDVLGLYSLAYKVAMVVGYAQLAFVTYWNAQMFTILRDGQGSSTYVRLCTYYVLALTATGVAITAMARPGLTVLTPAPFHPAIVFIPVLVGAYVVRGLADFLRSPLLVENRSGLNARALILTAVICLILYSILIPAYKAWGAVAATGLSFLAMAILSYWEAQRVRHFSFEYGRLLRIGLAGGASLGTMIIPSDHLLLQIGISLAGLMVFAGGLLLTGFFQPGEKDFAAQAWHSARGWIFSGASSAEH